MKTHLIRRQASSRSCNLPKLWPMLALLFVAAYSWPSLFELVNCAQSNSSSSNYSKSAGTPAISLKSSINNHGATLPLNSPFANANRSGKLADRVVSWKRGQSHSRLGGGYAVEVSPPPASMLFQYLPARAKRDDTSESAHDLSGPPFAALVAARQPIRGARVMVTSAPPAAVNYDDNEDEHDLFVTNTCERNHMLAEIKTSKPFYGLIHTLGHGNKLICTIEGDGGSHYKLGLGYALNQSEPDRCDRIKLDSASIESNPLASEASFQRPLSAILAIRQHKDIELSEYKIFAFNCTKPCRRPNCTSGTPSAAGRLLGELSSQQSSNKWRLMGMDSTGGDTVDLQQSRAHARPHLIKSADGQRAGRISNDDICSIWSSAWLVVPLLCLLLVLIALLATNCLICCSLRANEQDPDDRLAKRRNNGKLSPANNRKQVDKFETSKELKLSKPSSKGKCIEYDNTNLNHYSYENKDSHERQGQFKRSHRYHDAQLAGMQNSSSRLRNEQHR